MSGIEAIAPTVHSGGTGSAAIEAPGIALGAAVAAVVFGGGAIFANGCVG